MNRYILALSGTAVVLSCIISLSDGGGLGLALVPLATISGHGGLYASSLTSAALLKLKAAAALAALAKLTESGFHVKLGYGYAPDDPEHTYHGVPSGGWGWNSRRKRSVDELPEETKEEKEEYDPSYDEVLSYDQLGCGMRFVCELAATPYEQLGDDGKLILELFGRDGKAANLEKSSRGKLTYSYASVFGAKSKEPSACARVYARCPYDASTILASLRAASV